MDTSPTAIASCPQCGTQLAPTMLACPVCARLVHSEQLTQLAQMARQAAEQGDLSASLAAWREALALLPAGSGQHQAISAKITELGRNLPAAALTTAPAKAAPGGQSAAGQPSTAMRAATGLGALGLMAWKAKALLFGLTKASTLFSMALSLAVYWTVWGWQFALGLVLSLYVHEMGHVIALRRYGFKMTPPMFIPGLGAIVRLQQQIVNPREDADIGLAGPIYGLGAAVVSLGLWLATGQPIFAAIAGAGAWINLFNLLPIGTLDGGRGFHALSRQQRLWVTITAAAASYFNGDGMLLLLAVLGFFRASEHKAETEGYRKAALIYCSLILALAGLAALRAQAGVEKL